MDRLSMRRQLSLAKAFLREQFGAQALDEMLAEPPSRETWGTGAQAEAGLQAAIRLAGGS